MPPVVELLEFCVANTEPAPNTSVSRSAVASPSFFIIFNDSPSEGFSQTFSVSAPPRVAARLCHCVSHTRTRQRTCQRARTPRASISESFAAVTRAHATAKLWRFGLGGTNATTKQNRER